MSDNDKIDDRQPASISSSIGIGERLKAVRQELGIMEKEFAARLGVSETGYEQIESDLVKPGYDFLEGLVREYGVNLYYLLFGQGEKFGGHCEDCELKKPVKYYASKEAVHRFLEYFWKSGIVQYSTLTNFSRLYMSDKEIIDREIKKAGSPASTASPASLAIH